MLYWSDGVWSNELLISIEDLGFTRGFAVFEFFRTYGGEPFRLEEHEERFRESASLVGMPEPMLPDVAELTREAVRRLGADVFVRMWWTMGVRNPRFYFAAQSEAPCSVEPVRARTTAVGRSLPLAKTTHYLPALSAMRPGYEVVYRDNRGVYLEGMTSNFFLVRNGCLHTAMDGVLPGVTRGVVLELAQEAGIESLGGLDRLDRVTEAFLTSTTREICPVLEIDNVFFEIGPITKLLQEKFRTYVQSSCNVLRS